MSGLQGLFYTGDFHHFSYDGYPIILREYGRGLSVLPLVLIGGAFQNIRQIEKLSTGLAQRHWVIVVDTPGNGDTGVLPHHYRFDFLCEALHHALEAMGIKRMNMLGCSYGTIIALRYTGLYRTVDRLILAAAMARLPDRLKRAFTELVALLDAGEIRAFADQFTDLMTNPELRRTNKLCRITTDKLHHALLTASAGIRDQFRHNTLRIIADGDTDLRHMPDIPVTVLAGAHDQFVPPAANQAVADAFPQGRFIAIPDADHMIHVEKFRTMVDLVFDALENDSEPAFSPA